MPVRLSLGCRAREERERAGGTSLLLSVGKRKGK